MRLSDFRKMVDEIPDKYDNRLVGVLRVRPDTRETQDLESKKISLVFVHREECKELCLADDDTSKVIADHDALKEGTEPCDIYLGEFKELVRNLPADMNSFDVILRRHVPPDDLSAEMRKKTCGSLALEDRSVAACVGPDDDEFFYFGDVELAKLMEEKDEQEGKNNK